MTFVGQNLLLSTKVCMLQTAPHILEGKGSAGNTYIRAYLFMTIVVSEAFYHFVAFGWSADQGYT